MTTIDTRTEALASTEPSVAARSLSDIAAWITTTDHKRIGRMFVGVSLLLTLGVGVIGGLIGLERINPNGYVLDSGAFEQLFSLLRVGLAFFVVLPLTIGLAMAIVPLQVGARSIAFPRAALLGFWSWLFGSGLIIFSLAGNGGPGGGKPHLVDLYLGGVVLAIAGLVIAASTIAATVLTTRAPGLTLKRVPLFSYSALVGCVAIALTLPVLAAATVLVLVDHLYERSTFGGNAGVLQWTGWGLSAPAMLVYSLPLLGAIPDSISTLARRHLLQRPILRIGVGLAGVSAAAAVTQTALTLPARRHSFKTWENFLGAMVRYIKDTTPWLLFGALPILGVLIVVGLTGKTMAAPKLNVKVLLSAATQFNLIGGALLMAGFALHAVGDIAPIKLTGTVYEEGVSILVGYSVVLLALGALTFWGPKLWGRRIDDKKALPFVLLGAGGAVLASIPMIILGFMKQPGYTAGGFDKQSATGVLNALSMAGHALMLATVGLFVLVALMSFTKGELAGDDPYDGQTFEWMTSSPPPVENFAVAPTAASSHPLTDLKPDGLNAPARTQTAKPAQTGALR